jgi:hypothetical protein
VNLPPTYGWSRAAKSGLSPARGAAGFGSCLSQPAFHATSTCSVGGSVEWSTECLVIVPWPEDGRVLGDRELRGEGPAPGAASFGIISTA